MAQSSKTTPFLHRRWPIFSRGVIALFFLAFTPLFSLPSVEAQPYRESLASPPSKTYREILRDFHQRDYEKIERSLHTLQPLVRHLKSTYQIDVVQQIENGIRTGNHKEILLSIQQLIFLDTRDLFSLALNTINTSTEHARKSLRMAYRNYLLLSPYVQVSHFRTDQRIKTLFRRAATATMESKRLSQLTGEIETLLAKTLTGSQ